MSLQDLKSTTTTNQMCIYYTEHTQEQKLQWKYTTFNMAYRIQATIYKYGQIYHTLETLNDAKLEILRLIEMLKNAPEKTYKSIEILDTETGQIINAWNNGDLELFNQQNDIVAESNVIPHYFNKK